MIPLRISRRAFNDLNDIREYVAADNLPAADRQHQALLLSMQRLSEQPSLGRARPELGNDARALVVGEYLIIYRVEPDRIFVSRVIHGARDIPRVLNELPEEE